MTENGNWSEYDNLVGELEKDTRVGDHDWMVSEVREEAWADGSPRFKVQGTLLTSGNVRCDLTWSPPPAASVVKSEMASWTASRKRGVSKAIGIGKNLALWYGKSVPSMISRSQSDSASVAAPHPSRPVIPTEAGLSASSTSLPR